MNEELIASLIDRTLLTNTLMIARLGEWGERYAGAGAPDHICDGLRALLAMPRTQETDRAIVWILYSLTLVYEQLDLDREYV